MTGFIKFVKFIFTIYIRRVWFISPTITSQPLHRQTFHRQDHFTDKHFIDSSTESHFTVASAIIKTLLYYEQKSSRHSKTLSHEAIDFNFIFYERMEGTTLQIPILKKK
jgi:hypothetical protein